MGFDASLPNTQGAAVARVDTPKLVLPGFHFVTVTAVVLSDAQRRTYRRSYDANHSMLRDMVARNVGVSRYDLEGYEMHHWLPIGLAPVVDGRIKPHYSPNNIDNLDPVTSADHEFLHKMIIDPQYDGLPAGTLVTLHLPRRNARARPKGRLYSEIGLGSGNR